MCVRLQGPFRWPPAACVGEQEDRAAVRVIALDLISIRSGVS